MTQTFILAVLDLTLVCHASISLTVLSLTQLSANPFSVLDTDTVDYSETKPSTPSDHDSCPERPKSPHRRYPKLSSCTSSAIGSKKTSHKFEDIALTAADIDYMAPSFQAMPFTPSPRRFVRMPGSFSSSSDNDDSSISNFHLDNIRNPSPLLYHKSEGRVMFGTDQTDTLDFQNFELAHGQSKPEPDFATYRNIALDDMVAAVPTSHVGNDVTLAATKQKPFNFRSLKPGPAKKLVTSVATGKTGHCDTGPDVSVQAAREHVVERRLDESDVLDMPSGFNRKTSLDDNSENGQSQCPNIILESKNQHEDGNLIFPKLSPASNDQIRDVIRWSNNIAVPRNKNTAGISSPPLDKGVVSTAPPSTYRDLVLAISYPRTLSLLSGEPWYCNGTTQLPVVKYHDKKERTVRRTQLLKPIVFADQPSQSQGTKRYTFALNKSSEKPSIRFDDPLTQPKPTHGALAPGALTFDTAEDDEGYFTPSQIDSDEDLVDLGECEADWSDWEWDFEEVGGEAAKCDS